MSNYDPYKILQISPSSSLSEIKKAYYFLAKIYHPDKRDSNSNADNLNFLDIKTAFDLLSNENERHLLDCTRLTQDSVLQEQISFNELESNEEDFSFPCRCGGEYVLNYLEYVKFRLEREGKSTLTEPIYIYCDYCSGACEVS